MSVTDLYGGDYNIETPESVAFDFEIADLGNRFLAALIDTVLLAMTLFGINAIVFLLLERLAPSFLYRDFLDEGGSWLGGLVVAAYAILNFFVFWGYYIFQELRWDGQTLGKRYVRIRVVRVDGGPAGASEIVIRNLLRVVDLLPAAYLAGFVAIVANRQARRLGDLAAGTLVVKAGGRITLERLLEMYRSAPASAAEAAHEAGAPSKGDAAGLDLRRLRPADYGLITEALSRSVAGALDEGLVNRLAAAIAARLGYTLAPDEDPRGFLERIAAAYRRLEP